MFKLRLSRRGLLAYEPRTATSIRLEPQETEDFLGRSIPFSELDDFAEVVHLEISARCQLSCAYCYARDQPKEELTTDQWKAIIANGNKAGARTCEYMGAMEAFKHLNNDIFK